MTGGEKSALSQGSVDFQVSAALKALRGPRYSPDRLLSEAETSGADRPGLYAVYGNGATWERLGLGAPPDERPLYVGKAQDSLLKRDVKQHFGSGQTGRSTLRRTLAALLRKDLELVPRPRGSNPLDSTTRAHLFALHPDGELRLTVWMEGNLTLALWAVPPEQLPALSRVETAVIEALEPPLCLNKWSGEPWRGHVKAARRQMADMVRTATTTRSETDGTPQRHRRTQRRGSEMDVPAINEFVQRRLAALDLESTTAVEAAKWLDEANLLKDSVERRGKPLRDLMRAGRIVGQRQEPNRRWYIDRVDQR